MSTNMNVTVRGTNVDLLKVGTGPALLFLHGIEGPKQSSEFIQQLAKHYTVYYPVHPGFGTSDAVEHIESMEDLAYHYSDLLNELGIKRLSIIGSSLGGWLATELAVMEPSRVERLILMDACGVHGKEVALPDYFMMDQKEVIRNSYHNPSLIEEALAQLADEEQNLIEIKNRIAITRLAWNPYFHNPKLVHRIHRLNMPVQIIWGANDKLFPIAYGQLLNQLIDNSTMEVIQDCGHLPYLEQPDGAAELVLKFLNQ